jgi:hypothetical protein
MISPFRDIGLIIGERALVKFRIDLIHLCREVDEPVIRAQRVMGAWTVEGVISSSSSIPGHRSAWRIVSRISVMAVAAILIFRG